MSNKDIPVSGEMLSLPLYYSNKTLTLGIQWIDGTFYDGGTSAGALTLEPALQVATLHLQKEFLSMLPLVGVRCQINLTPEGTSFHPLCEIHEIVLPSPDSGLYPGSPVHVLLHYLNRWDSAVPLRVTRIRADDPCPFVSEVIPRGHRLPCWRYLRPDEWREEDQIPIETFLHARMPAEHILLPAGDGSGGSLRNIWEFEPITMFGPFRARRLNWGTNEYLEARTTERLVEFMQTIAYPHLPPRRVRQEEKNEITGGVPKREQYPELSYRGYLRRKYDYLMLHPGALASNHPYYVVLGALNDSTTEQARTYLRLQLGSQGGKYDAIYQEALQELDEEEQEASQYFQAE